MALNPNIIANAMTNITAGMPDASNLMAQRVQGMENIYKIETARQAAAEEEAAALKKEQEAAAIKALLPAYTYGIQTGDISGAGNLVPQEMRGQLQPFIDALTGKSPQEVQAALIGSLASSPEGQEALTAIQRAETASIQRGQLDVSRGNLDLDRQKAALDARGEGEWELKEGEGGFFWTNPRTREVIRAGVTGGATPIPAPDVVTPRAPAPGAPAVEAPIGTQQPPQEFRPKVKTTKEDDLTEGEGKAVNFTLRMADSDAVTNELEQAGVVTTDAITNFFLGIAQSLPLSAGANLASQLESAFNATSPTLTPEEQRLARAQLDFVTAILRSESGAEIKTSEFPAEYRKYFATEGDEGNEKLLADKRRARKLAIKGMKAKAGQRGQAEIDRILEEEGVGGRAAPAATPVAPGTSFEGFEVLGVEPD
jgi:phage terminase Nu1 subunit (DNA packaging protein)